MKISHEVPLFLLEDSLKFNDYQYCLPHYWEKYDQYKQFFINYRKQPNSFIILDNGLFEGGVFPEEKLLEIINELKPDVFIVPDAWNDFNITYNNALDWFDKKRNLIPKETQLMVVLQGKTYAEFRSMVNRLYEVGYRYFAFNHSSILYRHVFPHENELISKMMGRIKALDDLILEFHNDCKIHLLGVNLPQELIYLPSYIKERINSIDTSNPILVGALGKKYTEVGIDFKPFQKIEVFMEEDLASFKEDIIFNINKFREWCK